jgi:GPH family glycoside/pentoside/hexuronide:cation symporter
LFWWSFSPENPYLMLIPLPLFAFGIGSLFTIMMSMTADICDLDELETKQRREGTFGAIYWWMVKLGAAFAGGASGLILSTIGFDQTVAVQTVDTLELLRLSYIAIPAIGTLIAILVMRNYDLDEQRANNIRAQLEARQAK